MVGCEFKLDAVSGEIERLREEVAVVMPLKCSSELWVRVSMMSEQNEGSGGNEREREGREGQEALRF